MSLAPIVLFVFNRPWHTQKTIDALIANEESKDSDLWVFSDGPRNENDHESISKVRQVVAAVKRKQFFRDVTIVEAPKNRGLAKSIIKGVSLVIKDAGKVIVLEDDLVTSKDFLRFMNACLDFYGEDSSIGSIAGYSPVTSFPADYNHDVYLAARSCSLGWGTWKKCWDEVDWTCSEFAAFRRNPLNRIRFNSCGTDRYSRLKRQIDRGAESWSIRFGFWQFLSRKYTVYSRMNRVLNIGDDGSGVHDSTNASYSEMSHENSNFQLSSPTVNPKIIKAMKKVYSPTTLTRIRHLASKYSKRK